MIQKSVLIQKFKSLHWFIKFSFSASVVLLFLAFLSFLNWVLPTKVVSNTEVRGILIQDQVWEGEIHINGDLFALPLTTITINPGTKILVSRDGDQSNLDYLPWHLKSGVNTGPTEHGIENGVPFWDESKKIQIRLWKVFGKGEESKPIIISSDNPLGNIYDFNLIRVEIGHLEYINFSNFRRFEIGRNVLVKNSSFKYTGECAICINRGTPTIEENTFEAGKRNFIEVGFASPHIIGNNFLDSEGNGVAFNGINRSEIKLSGNNFHMPNKKAVTILVGNTGGEINQNLFEIGDIEIPCTNKVRIENNYIKSKVIFKNPESCKGEYLVDENFWDTIDIELVRNTKFVGITEDFKVNVPKILGRPPF